MNPSDPNTLDAEYSPKLSDELRMLMYWLANEDVYTSGTVRQWLQSKAQAEAAADLARLAANAGPEPRSFWYGFFSAFMVAFGTADAVTEKGPGGRKAGIRAALLLAGMGDYRAFAPLVRVFETEWNRKGKYQDAIEAALIGLLGADNRNSDISLSESDVAGLVERIWKSGRTRSELSPRLRDLLLLSLARLAALNSDSPILSEIATSRSSSPTRVQARQAAASLSGIAPSPAP